MAFDSEKVMAQASVLLQDGRFQEADDLLKTSLAEAAGIRAIAEGKHPEPPSPRSSGEIQMHLLSALVERAGHPPVLAALLDELQDAVAHGR